MRCDGDKKRAVFLLGIGPAMYKHLVNLLATMKPSDKTWQADGSANEAL